MPQPPRPSHLPASAYSSCHCSATSDAVVQPSRRVVLAALAASLGAAGLRARGAFAADEYPSRPLRLLVGYATGGPVDTTARLIGEALTSQLGQPVIVDNRPGASGVLAARMTQQAAADGYTLYAAASPTFTIAPHLQKTVPFDPIKDFTLVSLSVDYANVLLVRADSPLRNVADLVAAAKANPGSVSYGSAGVGGSNHLCGELLQSISGAKLVHVPYKGNAPAMADVLGGQITFMFDITSTAAAYVNGGKARALAVTSTTRNSALPGVPTMIEAGVPGFDVTGWIGVTGPAGLPAPIVQRLTSALDRAFADQKFRSRMVELGYNVVASKPGPFAERVQRDDALWSRVIRDANIPKE